MGTINERKRKDGTTSFTAQIIIKQGGRTVHSEAQTFVRRQAAAVWMKARERVLRSAGGLEPSRPVATLAEAIDRYITTTSKAIGRTKAQVLRSIKTHDIADMDCAKITSSDIVAFATELSAGRAPQTIGNYLSHLGAVFAIARPAWGYQLNEQAMRDAMKVAKRLGITSKSRERDRRPTIDELDRLMTHFSEVYRRRPQSVPMHVIIAFALFSTRRQEEITRIAYEDLDDAGSRILVRDMKNPGEKIGNNVWCDLPSPALDIIRAQTKSEGPIFPYTSDAISAAFTRACKLLGIVDLHFHDLRHDGISRLFEIGTTIPHAAAVSGHRSWTSLKRYTHIRQTGDKYSGWKWLASVATA